jgi:hypothetical protein
VIDGGDGGAVASMPALRGARRRRACVGRGVTRDLCVVAAAVQLVIGVGVIGATLVASTG